ncbi:class II fructose-bisphosphate aldolase [Streptomyces sp. NRRL B-24484]|uniref:class II fructose-bisphosphate aldolase n=1 Tax=Streptomyces sp. NRRL B-24484 TaxID=1463833 RepID=UPI0004C1B8C4|nr:class II fructose-bisphosphate aldolase [Streptomyces sp. NRRL B-24484]
MPLSTTAVLVTRAAARGGAVGAVNVITLEHIEAAVRGAERAGQAVILQISENAIRYHDGRPGPITAACLCAAQAAQVDVALHLDRVRSPELLFGAVDCGFSSFMIDAAHLPCEDNVAATRAAVDWAHTHGIWAEAELGVVGAKGPVDAHALGARTDPDEAARFAADTGVDALAVAIGSTHAVTDRTTRLDHGLLGRLRAGVGRPLVLHDSTGVPDDELAAAVAGGITKVGMGTAFNIAMTGAVRARLVADRHAVDPRGYLSDGRGAMATLTAHLLSVLNGPAAPAA